MSSTRSLSIMSVSIIFCFILTNCSIVRDDGLRRSLPEARQEFSNAIQQAYLEEDLLLSSKVSDFRVLDDPPDCISSTVVKVFASNNDQSVTISQFTEIFENMGWNSRRHPELTPDDMINYESPNEHILFSVLPLSQFDDFRIEYPNNISDYKNVYAVRYNYHYPNAETCVF